MIDNSTKNTGHLLEEARMYEGILPDLYLKQLQEIRRQAKKEANRVLYLQTLQSIGYEYFKKGQFVQARKYYQKGVKQSLEIKDYIFYQKFQNKIGELNACRGFTELAVNQLFEVLTYNTETEKSVSYNHLATICINKNELEKGKDYLQKSQDFNRSNHNSKLNALNLINQGRLILNDGDYIRSLQHYNEALLCAREEQFSYAEIVVLIESGDLFMEITEYKEATRIYREAFHFAEKLGYQYLYTVAKIKFIESLEYDGNIFLANSNYRNLEKLTLEMDYEDLKLRCMEGQYRCMQKEGKLKKAEKLQSAINSFKVTVQSKKEKFTLSTLLDTKERELRYHTLKNNSIARQQIDIAELKQVIEEKLKPSADTLGSRLLQLEEKFKKAGDTENQNELKEVIEKQRELDAYFSGLMNYFDSGTQSEPVKEIEIINIVRRALSLLEQEIAQSGAIIEHKVSGLIYGQEKSIVKVFRELILNAIKYSRKDTPIHINIASVEENNRYLFSINDNGIGIPSESLDKIFKLFYKVNTIQNNDVGIGLTVCKKIIQEHGSSIWVKSEEGKGTTFFFTLPIIL